MYETKQNQPNVQFSEKKNQNSWTYVGFGSEPEPDGHSDIQTDGRIDM